MFPLFFPPVATQPMDSVTTLAPGCFATEVDLREGEGYNYVCTTYGREVFRRPGPCRSCHADGRVECSCARGERLDPGDVDVIAFQIQLYELGLDADWIRRQVQYRGMESRERLRYELDGTERFFFDGTPSNRILPTGVQKAIPPKPPSQQVRPPPQQQPQLAQPSPQPSTQPHPPQQPQHVNQKRPTPRGRQESNLRYMESVENTNPQPISNKDDVLVMLAKMRLGGPEKDISVEPSGRRNNARRRRGRMNKT